MISEAIGAANFPPLLGPSSITVIEYAGLSKGA